MDKEWYPKLKIHLMDVINNEEIEEIPIGCSVDYFISEVGEPEAVPYNLTKKSKAKVYLYGNVSVMVETRVVSWISIDLHGYRTAVVEVGQEKDWREEEWVAFAKEKGWDDKKIGSNSVIYGDKVKITLTETGELEMLTIFKA